MLCYNALYTVCPIAQGGISNTLFCPNKKPKDIQFTVASEERKQQKVVLEMLEPFNVGHFSQKVT